MPDPRTSQVIRRLARIGSAVALAMVLTACGDDTAPAEPDPVQDETAFVLAGDDEKDGLDCDADDRAELEAPDCGFYTGSGAENFHWWGWAADGATTPPPGWSAADEVRPHRIPAAKPVTTRPAPKKTAPTRRTTR